MIQTTSNICIRKLLKLKRSEILERKKEKKFPQCIQDNVTRSSILKSRNSRNQNSNTNYGTSRVQQLVVRNPFVLRLTRLSYLS